MNFFTAALPACAVMVLGRISRMDTRDKRSFAFGEGSALTHIARAEEWYIPLLTLQVAFVACVRMILLNSMPADSHLR